MVRACLLIITLWLGGNVARADDEAGIQGDWHCVGVITSGKESPDAAMIDEIKQSKLSFKSGTVVLLQAEEKKTGKYTLDASAKPRRLKITEGEKVQLCALYSLDHDLLILAFGNNPKEFPKAFSLSSEPGNLLAVFQRKAVEHQDSQRRPAPVSSPSFITLRQIGLAFHNYLTTYNKFPRNICDKSGKPLLSWRVAILPYLEQDALYQQFKLDEPWNSEHNKNLIAKMPAIYALTAEHKKNFTTPFQTFIGNGAGMEPDRDIGIAQIMDGTSNTIMAVEARTAVTWTRPDDLTFDPKEQVQPLGSPKDEHFTVVMMDGSVHMVLKTISQATLKSLITRAGGEIVAEIPEVRPQTTRPESKAPALPRTSAPPSKP